MSKVQYHAFENEIILFWKHDYLSDPYPYKTVMYRIFVDGKRQDGIRYTHYELKNLKPDTEYHVEITCNGTPFDSLVVRTLKKKKKVIVTCDNSGKADVTKEVQELLDTISEDEELVFNEGTYLTGALFIHSGTTVRLNSGATIKGSENADGYPFINSRFEGKEMLCRASLINIGTLDRNAGYTTKNVTLYGAGSIVGGGKKLMMDTIQKQLPGKTIENYYKEFEAGRARGRLINVSNAQNIVISGLDLGYAPSWNVHMIYSDNVVTCGCKISSYGYHNGDGWDPDSSSNCYLFNTIFDVGDDCVAIKSGKNPEGNIINRKSENIYVFDCYAINGHGCSIGSEISGGIENVFFFDNDFTKTMLGLHIKTTKKRGGYIRNVIVSNTFFSTARIATVPYNDDGESSGVLTEISNINMGNVFFTGISYLGIDRQEEKPYIEVKGFEENDKLFHNINMENVIIRSNERKDGIVVENADCIIKDIHYERTDDLTINGDFFSDYLVREQTQKLPFDSSVDFKEYQKVLRQKFIEVAGIDKIEANACPINVKIIATEEFETYRQVRFTVETEKNNTVPCYVLIPKTGKEKYNTIITLQGHSNGMYQSIGELKSPEDLDYVRQRAFAIQAVEQGYAAVCIEQRGMGEQRAFKFNRNWEMAGKCRFFAGVLFSMGRTLIGERVWDVSKVIDALSEFEELDLSNLAITGNSGGGTASFYAACYDERIKLTAPSCSFCPYKESILSIYHCFCNYMPHAFEWFDMQDLAALIAPRKFISFTGVRDQIFPLEGVRRGFAAVSKIYQAAGAPQNAKLVEMPREHFWCEDIIWPEINNALLKR